MAFVVRIRGRRIKKIGRAGAAALFIGGSGGYTCLPQRMLSFFVSSSPVKFPFRCLEAVLDPPVVRYPLRSPSPENGATATPLSISRWASHSTTSLKQRRAVRGLFGMGSYLMDKG